MTERCRRTRSARAGRAVRGGRDDRLARGRRWMQTFAKEPTTAPARGEDQEERLRAHGRLRGGRLPASRRAAKTRSERRRARDRACRGGARKKARAVLPSRDESPEESEVDAESRDRSRRSGFATRVEAPGQDDESSSRPRSQTPPVPVRRGERAQGEAANRPPRRERKRERNPERGSLRRTRCPVDLQHHHLGPHDRLAPRTDASVCSARRRPGSATLDRSRRRSSAGARRWRSRPYRLPLRIRAAVGTADGNSTALSGP